MADAAWHRRRQLMKRAAHEGTAEPSRSDLYLQILAVERRCDAYLVPVPENWSEMCLRLLVKSRGASERARGFVADVSNYQSLTPKQWDYFSRLYKQFVGERPRRPASKLDS